MDHKNAVELLEETFEQEFDIDRFANFVKELFNHFNVSIRDVPLWKEYYDYVENVKSLGVYRDNDKHSIEVFAIKLKRTSSRDRARTMQRNLIARYLNNFNRDAALVAFYGDDPEDWRFSFVKMEYELTKDEQGNLKVTEELTPARRYSFLVGQNEPNHTCKIQFLGLIKEEAIDPQLSQIEETFSIEKVTKEFFNEYKELYLKLQESLEKSIENDEVILQEFEDKIIKTSDFAKKLMGQIVFIYFLQKKGWLGVEKGNEWGTGPKKFLRKLFDGEIVKYDNFFNDVLEHLFYDALSSKSEGDYYDKFGCKIPFLNGGLFEPINDYDWLKTDIQLKNDIFKEILNTFDRYNFTVKEDEPLEKEVAVDPEMLGKVFENLLEIEDRKSKGAFYTPREIVHYMCQESLINYLNVNSKINKEDIENFIRLGDVALGSIIKEQEQIKKYKKSYEKPVLPKSIRDNNEELDLLLRKIKVVDPAVGSGAFPVGMMNEIIRARTILSLYSHNNVSNYELKLETIENCLYGVDIDSSAVDITKLRFWLSLIVDEENVATIDPLPNLDHKIMCGNSLLEEFEGMKLFDDRILTSNSQDTTSQSTLDKDFNLRIKKSQVMLKKLKNLLKLFFKEQDSQLKKEYREEIDKIEWDLIEETLLEDGNEDAIHRLKEYKTNKSKPFFLWKLYFSEIFNKNDPGFDVVIANPPYIEFKRLDANLKKQFKKTYQSAKGKYDIYVIFLEFSKKLMNEKGCMVFINPTMFMKRDYGKEIRKFIESNYQIINIVDFSDIQVFENATNYTGVFIFSNNQNDHYNFVFKKFKRSEYYTNIFEFVYSLNSDFNTPISDFMILDENDLNFPVWNFNNPEINNVMKSISDNKERLFDITDEIFQGIASGKDEVFYIKKNSLESNSLEKEIIFPLLKGKDVKKYRFNWSETYVLYPYDSDSRPLDEDVISNEFPHIYNYLKEKRHLLKGRSYFEKSSKKWYEIWNQRKFQNFNQTRIVVPEISKNNNFMITDKFFGNTKTYHIILKDKNIENYKYLLALLNSSLIEFYYHNISVPKSGGFYAYKTQFLNLIPIKFPNSNVKKRVITIVDQILGLFETNLNPLDDKNDVINRLINEIDHIIFDVYELNTDEINIIKNFKV